MTDQDIMKQLYTRWLSMAACCPTWIGADAEEAVSEALEVALNKPVNEDQAAGVFRRCLMRVLNRRIRQD